MSINLVQAVKTAISESIAEQLSQKFGIPGQIVQQLTARTVPGLVATLMDRSALEDGARSVFAAIMSAEANAFVVEQLNNVITTTSGLKHLEGTGHSLAARAAGQRIDALTDAVSLETGVPVQATSAFSGILAAVLFGVLKHYFLLSQGNLKMLPVLLRDQIGEVRGTLSNSIAGAIGLGNTEGFATSIRGRLEAMGAVFGPLEEVPSAAPAMSAASAVSAVGHSPVAKTEPSFSSTPTASPAAAPMRAPVRKSAKKQTNKWVWLLFAVLAAILALVYYRGFTHSDSVNLNTSATTSPLTPIEQPASAVEPVASVEPVAPVAASAAAATANVPASTPAAPALAAAPAQDARLLFNVSATGTPSIEATVGTDAEKKSLVDALSQRFGKDYGTNVSVVAATAPAPWLAHLNDLMPLMAVPGAEAKLTGSKVELSGAANIGWADRLKNTLGGMFQISSFDADSAVASATKSFRGAMKTLLTTDESCSGEKLTKVLDLQVINFARSSATVPTGASSTLNQTADLLKSCAAKGSMVNLEVAGYADSVGAAAAKLEMSKERAQAVRAYLVRAGVPPQTLTATGHGDANPIADNATESGRFANRRIAFVVR